MKILVVIANHGMKNKRFLDVLLEEYRSMSHEVDIVILSDVPKDLGSDIKVRVGAPTDDPWSLPFGYVQVFEEYASQYDIYIYSEDDTLLTEVQIDGFLRVNELLPEDEIPGFLRYEIGPEGAEYYSTIHGAYHWEPKSVKRAGDYVLARYTNDHSACFVITRAQLARGLERGGLSKGVRSGLYDKLCTAATEPYTQFGLTKLVPVSHLWEFSLHHLPDIYLGLIGIRREDGDREAQKLLELEGVVEGLEPLVRTETFFDETTWNKSFYEHARGDILGLIPSDTQALLSVGCGFGHTEEALVKRGVRVTGIPLDCVIAVSAAARGVRTISPCLDEALRELGDEQFECILITDVLHHFNDPKQTLRRLLLHLAPRGRVVLSAPNFHHPRQWRRRLEGKSPLPKATRETAGVVITSPSVVGAWLSVAGLRRVGYASPEHLPFSLPFSLDQWLGCRVVVAAQRCSET